MATEADNRVLKMLREIRGGFERHEERFDKIDTGFDEVDKKLDAMSESLTFAPGVSMQTNVAHTSAQKKLDARAQRVKRLEERV